MIEVEKKCLATAGFLDFLKNNATKLGECTLKDVYLDFDDLNLVKNDIWLRKRNEKYELKIPLAIQHKTDVYEEIEDDTEILTRLNLKNFEDLIPLAVLVTRRQKFKVGDFNIDLDEITSPGTEFLYNMMEIELMVDSPTQYESAQKKILEFMNEHSLKNEIVNGKVVEFIRRYHRDVFELLKKNPRYANRIVD